MFLKPRSKMKIKFLNCFTTTIQAIYLAVYLETMRMVLNWRNDIKNIETKLY